jgi:exonuclease III
MLSDLTSVLASRKVPVVLAGDLNITTQGAKSPDNEAAAVFARLRAWGLVDCIAHSPKGRPERTKCDCLDGDACCHVQTYRHNNRAGACRPQLDYAFVSERLLPRLKDCRVVDEEAAWALSDHCPILLDVDC